MNLSQKQVRLAILLLLAIGSGAISIAFFTEGRNFEGLTALIASPIYFALTYAYWRGIEFVRYIAILSMLLASVVGIQGPFLTEHAPLANAMVPIVATLMAGPAWILGSMASLHLLLLIKAGFSGIYLQPETITLSVMVGGGLMLSRLVTDRAQRVAEENAQQAKDSLGRVEQQAEALAEQADELRQRNEQQQRLLDLVTTLETPAVTMAEGVILAPIVGHLDSRRATSLTTRVLSAVSSQRARLVILDIAGVATVDTQVAHVLLQTVQAVRLLGCDAVITGISASVATTLTHLGVALEGISAARTPQDALAALEQLDGARGQGSGFAHN